MYEKLKCIINMPLLRSSYVNNQDRVNTEAKVIQFSQFLWQYEGSTNLGCQIMF